MDKPIYIVNTEAPKPPPPPPPPPTKREIGHTPSNNKTHYAWLLN